MATPGRPTSFKPDFIETARQACELGATERKVAEMLGVSERTLNTWKHTHPEFLQALKGGKAPADQRVVQSLYRRATGYSFDAVKFHLVEGKIVATPYIEHVPPDTTAIIYWLKNRLPDQWRDRREVQVEGSEDLAAMLEAARARAGLVG